MTKHIIELLDEKPFDRFSEAEMVTIRQHISNCAECEKAFEAARVSTVLLNERKASTHEPSAFFQTRVLARLREREASNEVWNFGRLWRATSALASSMVATVAALAVLTLVLPAETSVTSQETVSVNRYSAEAVILNQSQFGEELQSDSQVLTTLYGSEEEVVR
ncbi:MAG TPA: hypothetical protein VJ023_20265 [Pyrinomonadaceae bacterium]|nr:hypothetical protein [Pyrinomonadaceae bacterium]